MTDQQRQSYITALLEERAYHEKRGEQDRISEIDAELAKQGVKAKAPAKRAEKRPAGTAKREAR